MTSSCQEIVDHSSPETLSTTVGTDRHAKDPAGVAGFRDEDSCGNDLVPSLDDDDLRSLVEVAHDQVVEIGVALGVERCAPPLTQAVEDQSPHLGLVARPEVTHHGSRRITSGRFSRDRTYVGQGRNRTPRG